MIRGEEIDSPLDPRVVNPICLCHLSSESGSSHLEISEGLCSTLGGLGRGGVRWKGA